MVTLEAAVNSSRSLLFEGGADDHVEYWLGGSCMVATYRGHGFIITAKHALGRGNEKRAEKLRVFPTDDYRGMSLPYDMRIDVSARPGVPEQAVDLELVHIASERLNEDQARFVSALDLGAMRLGDGCPHRLNDQFIIPGFPLDRKALDYERSVISQQRVIHGAALTESRLGGRIHVVKLDSPAAHESLNGMSGAPVFSRLDRAEQIYCPTFDGIVVLGTLNGTSEAAFICSRLIFGALDQAVDGLR
jgi:hypothetical protein